MSLLLAPRALPLEQLPLLAVVAALGVREAIARLSGLEAQIKWPNDLLIDGAKVAGLLIETRLEGNQCPWAVVGVGLNLNQTSFEGLPGAASLLGLSGRPVPREAALEAVVNGIGQGYDRALAGEGEALWAQYHAALYGAGQWRPYTLAATGTPLEARLQGVDAQGRLILEPADGGGLLYLAHKEVIWA